MKNAVAAAMLVAACWSQPASAALQTYTFSGHIDRIAYFPNQFGNPNGYPVYSADGWTNGTINLSEGFAGRFTFDDEMAPGAQNNHLFSIAFNPQASFKADTFIAGIFGSPDSYSFSTGGADYKAGFYIYVADVPAPGQPAPLNGRSGQIHGTWWSSTNGQAYYTFDGTVDSFVNAAPVPEPSTVAMLLAGFGLLAARAHHLRAKRQ